jgi:3',5'-cyclic AMP phosphodiesterase CpdA
MSETQLRAFRSKQASLWQSAVDKVAADAPPAPSPAAGGFGDEAAAPPSGRTTPGDPDLVASLAAADEMAAQLDAGETIQIPPAPGEGAVGFMDTVGFCSKTALRIAEARVKSIFTGDTTELKVLQEEIGAKFGQCDIRWTQVIADYVKNRVGSVHIPYRVHTNLSDFTITGSRFPNDAKIAIMADWGTGDGAARGILKQIAAKNPDVVIHLGDVYYSGAEHEFREYFYPIWRDGLGLPDIAWGKTATAADLTARPATFTLSGNHDMYAGGGPYYTTLDMLGQPASYFCLRNDQWQFVALDTGLHDSDPTQSGKEVTFLEPTEIAWLKDKMATADGRKTVLLSHHQLYTAFAGEKIGGGVTNQTLLDATQDILPRVAAWFWGHEHNLVIFEKFQAVLGRCIGHGAFPVGKDELSALIPGVPVKNVALETDNQGKGGLLQHGYVTIQLTGDQAAVTYFQYDPVSGAEKQIFDEKL